MSRRAAPGAGWPVTAAAALALMSPRADSEQIAVRHPQGWAHGFVDVPAFIREEGPLYVGGPIWRVQQISAAFAP